MKFYSLVCSVAIVFAVLAGEAQAQTVLQSSYGPVVQPTVPTGGIVGTPAFAPPGTRGPGYGVPGYGISTYPAYPRPSTPVYVTPERYTGYNPQTGGWNTTNTQVNNTFYDQGRDASRYNGTSQYVRRPVYDSYGRVVGYEEGEVWRNSVTGQEHGNLITNTPNSSGGVQQTVTLRSVAQPRK